jgi:F0F1-type ATP synthase membrane subunit b/b'
MTISNSQYDPKQIESYLSEIDAADDRLASLQSDYMTKCKGPRGDIKMIFEAAKEAGLPARPFKTLVKNHRLERRIENNRARLEADDFDELESLEAALGDFITTPLGRATAERQDNREAALDTLG